VNTRKLKVLLVFFAILLLTGCSQSPSSTTQKTIWNTYNDPETGLSFQYPSDWPIGSPDLNDNEKKINLYVGDPDIEIWINVSYASEKTKAEEEDYLRWSDNVTNLSTNQGFVGDFYYGNMSGTLNVFVLKPFFGIDPGIVYTLYAKVPFGFNEKTIYNIAKSIEVSPPPEK